jgi:hypothetical protein
METSANLCKLRILLETIFPLTDELDAFCIDEFPSLAKQFSSGMTRTQKVNLLFAEISAQKILYALNRFSR